MRFSDRQHVCLSLASLALVLLFAVGCVGGLASTPGLSPDVTTPASQKPLPPTPLILRLKTPAPRRQCRRDVPGLDRGPWSRLARGSNAGGHVPADRQATLESCRHGARSRARTMRQPGSLSRSRGRMPRGAARQEATMGGSRGRIQLTAGQTGGLRRPGDLRPPRIDHRGTRTPILRRPSHAKDSRRRGSRTGCALRVRGASNVTVTRAAGALEIDVQGTRLNQVLNISYAPLTTCPQPADRESRLMLDPTG